ncbi:MAG: 16S rRNA (guanine(966)-N(2))-methyltransferase RsmD [Desulfuromonadales bacterium]|nr:16S rRNA (guanine(966)-N(2))-methyltransferase RsmD [Desulfuromonadales bacterium]
MRIIAGSARGKKLATFDGKQIRPTPDRVREALFSTLNSRFGGFNGLKVLELFAGTGAQSLEALSRGAATAVMIEHSSYAIKLMKENIAGCGFGDRVTLLPGELPACLDKVCRYAPFDLILLDPPYHTGLTDQVLARVESLNLLADGGIICAETQRNEMPEYQGALTLLDRRCYGSTAIHLFGLP